MFASLCILKIYSQVELGKCIFQIALLIFTVLILSFGTSETSDADGNSMITFQLSIIFPSFIWQIFNLFLILSPLFFHVNLLSQQLTFQFSFYKLFPFLGIIENLSNRFQEIFLFPALDDEKYVFALLCLKIYSWVQCLFSFYCYSSLHEARASRVCRLPSKRMEFPSSPVFTHLNLHAEGYIEV